MAKTTIIDVAKYAGVSAGTVSRVINNKKVKPMIQEKVEEAIKILDYQPNNTARTLRTNKTNAFAFLISDISNFTFSTIAKSLSDVLDQYGYSLILYNLGTENVESKLEHFFSVKRVDGAFLALPEENNLKINRLLNNLNLPLLIFDRQIKSETADFVFSDYYNGIRTGTEHLISLGHKNIAFLTGSLDIYPAREGIRGFTDALKLNNISVNESIIRTGEFTIDFGLEEIENLIPQIKKNEITALITGGVPILTGVLKSFQQHHIIINKDISIISFEDSEITQIMSITAIRRPLQDIGTKMAYSLINKSLQKDKEKSTPSSLVLPTELVIRSSISPDDIKQH